MNHDFLVIMFSYRFSNSGLAMVSKLSGLVVNISYTLSVVLALQQFLKLVSGFSGRKVSYYISNPSLATVFLNMNYDFLVIRFSCCFSSSGSATVSKPSGHQE